MNEALAIRGGLVMESYRNPSRARKIFNAAFVIGVLSAAFAFAENYGMINVFGGDNKSSDNDPGATSIEDDRQEAAPPPAPASEPEQTIGPAQATPAPEIDVMPEVIWGDCPATGDPDGEAVMSWDCTLGGQTVKVLMRQDSGRTYALYLGSLENPPFASVGPFASATILHQQQFADRLCTIRIEGTHAVYPADVPSPAIFTTCPS